MRIQSAHSRQARTLADDPNAIDPYMTDPRTVRAFLALEHRYLPPGPSLDPCCGTGAWVTELRGAGFEALGADIHDYGFPGTVVQDYLIAPPIPGVKSIVTNPPFCVAMQFAKKALREVDYVAFLVRSNFYVEAAGRDRFFEEHPPARIYFASTRLPMMHRYGWAGKQAGSNTAHCFLVWDDNPEHPHSRPPVRFNWKDLQGLKG